MFENYFKTVWHRSTKNKSFIAVFFAINSIFIISCSNPNKPAQSENNTPIKNTALNKVDSKKIDDFLSAEMKGANIPGVSIAIVHKGHVIYKKGYGLANLEFSIPVTPKSAFKIASLTKPFTAAAIMQLVEEGKVSLDEKLSYYLDYLPKEWNTITVRQLLSHTSGLADYFQAPDWSWKNSWRLDLSHDEFIKMTEKSPMAFNPGEKIQYCNTGYYLLGMLIENVSGGSYEDYLKEYIFNPLEMINSRLDHVSEIIPNRVSGYSWEKGEWKNSEFTSDTWAFLKAASSQLRKIWQSLIVHFILKNFYINPV